TRLSPRPVADSRNRRAEVGGGKVVQQDHVHARVEQGIDLLQAIHLNLDDQVAVAAARPTTKVFEGFPMRPRHRKVIILELDAVIEAESVIPAAAGGHGIFFEETKTGGGLACIKQAGTAFAES